MLFRKSRAPLIDPNELTSSLSIDGREIPVLMKRHAKARRLIMRLNKQGNGVNITLPPGSSPQAALEFAAKEATWILSQLTRQPSASSLEAGATIPFRGTPHLIVHRQQARGGVWLEDSETEPKIIVSGQAEHLKRRLLDWLKRAAKRELTAASSRYAASMGLSYSAITVRDTTSRWGSCSSSGRLNYSWRLILAPDDVLDYVCAHEVAHLREMNHGPRFWALVNYHCAHAERSRKWLKANGRKLHGVG